MTPKEMRELLGVSRAEFSRRYGIPIRTLENWDAGINEPPEWALNLLERVVTDDASGGKNGGIKSVNPHG